MDKKYIYVIIIGIIIAVIVAAILLYLSRTKQQLAVQATLGQSQTVTLSNSNPNQSVTINIPYGDNVTFGINISNAAPNSSYTVALNGSSTTISTDSSGSGSTTLSTGSLTSSTTVNLTISGPGISSAYTLTVDFEVVRSPQLQVVVGGRSFSLSNSINSGEVVVTGNTELVLFILSNGSPNSQYSVLENQQLSTGGNSSNTYTETTNSSGMFTLTTELSLPSNNTTLTATYTITGPGIEGSFIFTVILGPPLPSSSPSPSPSSNTVTFNNPCNCPFEVIGFNPNYPPTATRPAPVDEYIEPLLSVTIPYTPPMVFQIWNLVNDGPVAQYTNPTGTITLSCGNCGNFFVRH